MSTPANPSLRVTFSGLMVAIFLAALDQTIVAVALPRMSQDLGSPWLLGWIAAGYMVSMAISSPLYGRFADMFGRQLMMTAAIAIFAVASLLCAIAQTMPQLIAARLLQGVGGAGLMIVSQAVISDLVSVRERGRYQGYISGMFLVSSVIGPPLGGFFTSYLSWRWIFWINLPLSLLAWLVIRHALRDLPFRPRREPIDYLGSMLLALALGSSLVGITLTGQGRSWSDPWVVFLLIAGGTALALFVWWQRRARAPLLPPALFRTRTVGLCLAITFIVSIQVVSLTMLFPLRYQLVTGASAAASAIYLIPVSFGVPCGAIFTGHLMARTGRYRPIHLTGSVIVGLSMMAVGLLGPTDVWPMMIATFLVGFAGAMHFPNSMIAIQNSVRRDQIGIATGSYSLFRTLGPTVGVAVLTSLLLALLHQADLQLPPMAGEASDFLSELLRQVLSPTPGVDPTQLRASIENTFQQLQLATAALSLLTLLLALALPEGQLSDQK
ncbi:MAG: MDR family MFS transporter [Spongiibacteraceae bacterium]|jgi:EmrB/QacA subfamily drug resistance transporter|nr:MDR family MFS transporter [Spongiibacteraceae bacterium]